jgi:Flp pilus assembly protein TadD
MSQAEPVLSRCPCCHRSTDYETNLSQSSSKKPEEYSNQGKKFLKAKQYDQAIVSFSEAIKLDSQSVEAHNNRGIAY